MNLSVIVLLGEYNPEGHFLSARKRVYPVSVSAVTG